MVHEAIGLHDDRCFQIANRFRPTGGAKHLSAQEGLGQSPRKAVQSHHLGVPDTEYVQRAGMLRKKLERLERFLAHFARIRHAIARIRGECRASHGARQLEMPLGLVRIRQHGPSRVVRGSPIQRRARFDIRLELAQVHRFTGRLPERGVRGGLRLNRPLEIIERRARTPRRAVPVSRGQQIADVLRGEGTRCQWQARQCEQCGTHGESNRRASCRASCQLACHVTCGAGREDVGWLHHED